MQQLILDLIRPAPPGFDNFVPGPNAEALDRIRAVAQGDRGFRLIYLWGQAGTGKTHLLRALRGPVLGPDTDLAFFAQAIEPGTVIAVDDCDRLDATRQAALFQLFNHVLAEPKAAIVCAGLQAPQALAVRDDLRTRLGYGLVLRLLALPDEALRAAIERQLTESGTPFAPDLIDYLLRHKPRDLRSLLALLHALDRYALERQRMLTVPLLRDFERQSAVKLHAS